jgi:hypothetical protein
MEDARASLIAALEASDSSHFEVPDDDGTTVKHCLERTADDVNFYYGRLAARALNLPQPPCMIKAEFGSLREGTMALQVAHRRFTNLLHDLVDADLDRHANDQELGSFSLRQVLEMAAAQYVMRAQQVRQLAGPPAA